jgi:hypothetical protein
MKRKAGGVGMGADNGGASLQSGYSPVTGASTRQPTFQVPLQSKMYALDMLMQTIVVEKRISIGAFADCMVQLFTGLETCLRT